MEFRACGDKIHSFWCPRWLSPFSHLPSFQPPIRESGPWLGGRGSQHLPSRGDSTAQCHAGLGWWQRSWSRARSRSFPIHQETTTSSGQQSQGHVGAPLAMQRTILGIWQRCPPQVHDSVALRDSGQLGSLGCKATPSRASARSQGHLPPIIGS